jgi:hypothetical protein
MRVVSCLGVFEIRQAQNGLGLLAVGFGARILLHSEWPSCHIVWVTICRHRRSGTRSDYRDSPSTPR